MPIRLQRKQKLNIWATVIGDMRDEKPIKPFTLYDSKLKKISMKKVDKKTGKYRSKTVLPKGTYYMQVKDWGALGCGLAALTYHTDEKDTSLGTKTEVRWN